MYHLLPMTLAARSHETGPSFSDYYRVSTRSYIKKVSTQHTRTMHVEERDHDGVKVQNRDEG